MEVHAPSDDAGSHLVYSRKPPALDRLCDRCGASTLVEVGRDESEIPAGASRDIYETHNDLGACFEFVGAYGSTRFDMQTWEADLCEDCCLAVRELIDAGPGPGMRVHDLLSGQALENRDLEQAEPVEPAEPTSGDQEAHDLDPDLDQLRDGLSTPQSGLWNTIHSQRDPLS